MSAPRIGILVGTRGRGSNMRALAQACASGRLAAEVGLVVGPRADAPALEVARAMGLPVRVHDFTAEDAGPRLAEALSERRCRLLCLAGFLRLLPTEVLDAFPGRVLNIHPALLPKFGGKGMYGRHVHEAVLAAGETESGCSIHRVTPVYDEGEVVLQRRCPVLPGDTPDTLAGRVLALEHQAYAEAVAKVLRELDGD
ncbi:MAG: phosphoribosylglycinamide formyltransferase [Fimbriimonadaceae bacterium]|nr:phosphoribosylglycinamide formyltransferase [Fimbriimonadaceae bacterium]